MKEAEVCEEIAGCALFDALSSEEKGVLATHTQVISLAPRDILFHQGDPADTVYLVAHGQVKLSKLTPDGEQVIVAFVTPGQLFAVVAAMQTTVLPVTAEAVSAAELLAWSHDVMQPVLHRHPEIAITAMQVVSGRMRELQERYRELATLTVPQRLAKTLVRLAEQSGRPTGGGVAIDLRLSRQDLAELTGTTLYTVSRILSGWANEGIVDTGRESVAVRSLPRLQQLASENPGER